MPDYPLLSGAAVIATFEGMGFVRMRRRGSHVVLRRGSQGCVVPLHKELKRGTLSGIVRQAGVEPSEFIAAARD